MKKANKLLAMVLAVLMLAALCACSTGTDASTPTDSPEASATPDAAQPTEAPSRDETVDFVVVGAGAGGVSTAIEAVRQGKNVVLLEKLGFAGGSSALNEGYLWACGSSSTS